MEEQSFRSEQSEQVQGKWKSFPRLMKTSLTHRAWVRVGGPWFTQGMSSTPLCSVFLGIECFHCWVTMPRARGRDIRYRINHTENVLLGDRLWWTGSFEIRELPDPLLTCHLKYQPFSWYTAYWGKQKHTRRPLKRYLCFIANRFLCVQNQMPLWRRWRNGALNGSTK